MNLDEAQKRKVSEWIEQGLKLSEIQSKLASELGITMTYMEVRFLIDDLKLRPKDPEPSPAPTKTPEIGKATESQPPPPLEAEEMPEPAAGAPGNVSVTVDQITRPGALVSGKVTFSDGNTADWYLDQMGRLGIAAKTQGYRPPQSDIMAFQQQLQNELAKLGF